MEGSRTIALPRGLPIGAWRTAQHAPEHGGESRNVFITGIQRHIGHRLSRRKPRQRGEDTRLLAPGDEADAQLLAKQTREGASADAHGRRPIVDLHPRHGPVEELPTKRRQPLVVRKGQTQRTFRQPIHFIQQKSTHQPLPVKRRGLMLFRQQFGNKARGQIGYFHDPWRRSLEEIRMHIDGVHLHIGYDFGLVLQTRRNEETMTWRYHPASIRGADQHHTPARAPYLHTAMVMGWCAMPRRIDAMKRQHRLVGAVDQFQATLMLFERQHRLTRFDFCHLAHSQRKSSRTQMQARHNMNKSRSK
ncbi:Hypothetical protein AT6N2_L0153 [Agrobacterium tumefaciens]|nr:Hypothetical protein AT6N2_L0153 [Agrobacterium tumefaciens]